MTTQKAAAILTFLLAFVVLLGGATTTFRSDSLVELTGKWSGSAHADRTARSFTYWNADDPPVIPVDCAKCHSNYGFLDYLGEIGENPGEVDHEPLVGSVVSCTTCHNVTAHAMTQVTFPSGLQVSALGGEGECLICHQGTQAGADVDEAIAGLMDDEIGEALSFINVHYGVASATQWGAEVAGGYQYPGRSYVGFYGHVAGYRTCIDCHDPHNLMVDPQDCSPCHYGVVDAADLVTIRTDPRDYDGDGDTDEGIAAEIEALRQALLQAMKDYAAAVIEAPIVYGPDRFPYFFAVDLDADGQPNPLELHFGNRYVTWTPRLLRTAYNYQFASKDSGNYTHNPRYVLQLLYDSLEDLGERVPVPALSSLTRP
jgi:hypothetical protein